MAATSGPLLPAEVTKDVISNIRVSSPTDHKDKLGKSAKITLGANRDSLRIQTGQDPLSSETTMPFGASRFGENGKLAVNLTMSEELHKVLTAIDEHILELAAKNSADWFGKVFSVEALRENFYTPIVLLGKVPGTYPPRFKATITEDDGINSFRPATKIWCYQPETTTSGATYYPSKISEITQRGSAAAVFELGAIWFKSRSFGVNLRCIELLLAPTPAKDSFTFRLPVEPARTAPPNPGGSAGPIAYPLLTPGYGVPSSCGAASPLSLEACSDGNALPPSAPLPTGLDTAKTMLTTSTDGLPRVSFFDSSPDLKRGRTSEEGIESFEPDAKRPRA